MKVRITGKSDRVTNLKRPVPARQPAGLLPCTAKRGKRPMRLPVGRGEKGFHQGANRHIALRMLPSLRNDLAILIEQQIGQVRVIEVVGQQRRSRLRMQVLRRGARGCSALHHTEHKNHRRQEVPFAYCIQRYVTVCWILSFVWRVTICSASNLAKARLKLAIFREKNCGSASCATACWSTRPENLYKFWRS